MEAPQAEGRHQDGRADPVAVGIAFVVAVISTLVLLFALFVVDATQTAEPGAPVSRLVLLPGMVGCVVGWFAAFFATDDRSVATGLSVFLALAADGAALWLGSA